MKRTPINPWPWSLNFSPNFGFNQAEIVEGYRRVLICSGQAAVDADGHPQHAGDMRSQFGMALDNLETVLIEARMEFSNIVRLDIYTIDVDEAIRNFDVLGIRFGSSSITPPNTLVGIARLAFPELMIELEATAVA